MAIKKKVAKKVVGPQVGSIVHVTTVTYAYRGKLVEVSDQYLQLAEAVIVFDTGELKAYRANMRGATEETTASDLYVSRGAVVAVEVLR